MWHRQPDTAQLRVLLVDDDHVVRHVLAGVMTQHGLVVEEAADGMDALDRLRTCAPDIVVTDLHMPRLKGDELCSRLKADPSTRHIPVVVMTGSSVDESELRAIGCDRLITKPVTGAALAAAVGALTSSPVELGADGDAQHDTSGTARARATLGPSGG